jgi:hypothetical protein
MQSVYIRSNDHQKVQKTLEVIKLMEQNGVKPTLASYKHVLSACSRVPQEASETLKKKAVEIAAIVLEYLRDNDEIRPDSHSYNTVLWVCNLISDEQERRETINAVFQMCCRDGYLSRQFLATLKQIAGSSQFYTMVGHTKGHVDVTLLDPSWSRNTDLIQQFSPSRRKK